MKILRLKHSIIFFLTTLSFLFWEQFIQGQNRGNTLYGYLASTVATVTETLATENGCNCQGRVHKEMLLFLMFLKLSREQFGWPALACNVLLSTYFVHVVYWSRVLLLASCRMTKNKHYHRWVLHPSGPHSPLCHCRSCRGWGRQRCRWHRGIWVVCRQQTHRTLHPSGPHSQCRRHTPSSLWYTCL